MGVGAGPRLDPQTRDRREITRPPQTGSGSSGRHRSETQKRTRRPAGSTPAPAGTRGATRARGQPVRTQQRRPQTQHLRSTPPPLPTDPGTEVTLPLRRAAMQNRTRSPRTRSVPAPRSDLPPPNQPRMLVDAPTEERLRHRRATWPPTSAPRPRLGRSRARRQLETGLHARRMAAPHRETR
jgi:hypothetical protein